MTPSILPRISVPMKSDRVHSPRFTDASACGTERASANRSAIVCSAAATMFPRGALTTRMPLRVAAGTSMLSTPTPARPTTRRRRPASRTGAVTFVSLRTTRASNSGIRSISSASTSLLTTVTSPARRSRSKPSSASGSATRIRGNWDARPLSRDALQRGGSGGHCAALRRGHVQLFERLLDRPQHLHHIAFRHGAEVADADHLAGHLSLAAGDDDAELLVEDLPQRGNIDTRGRHSGCDRVRAVALLREELEAQRLQP